MMKTVLRVTFSCILALFLAILCLAGGMCHFAQNAVCDPAPLLQITKDSGTTRQLFEEIQYDWENLLSITGVTEPDTIMAVLTEEQVEKDTLKYITDSYSGAATLDTDELRRQLDEKVRSYAYSHNIHATSEAELEQNINDLVDACINDYRETVRIPLLPTLLGKVSQVSPYFSKLLPFIAAGAFVLLLFLFFLQKKRQDTLYYACISITTGGIVLLGVNLLATHYDILNRLPFADSAIKTLIVSYLAQILNTLQRYGIVYLLVAAIILIVYLLICAIILLIRTAKKKPTSQAQ